MIHVCGACERRASDPANSLFKIGTSETTAAHNAVHTSKLAEHARQFSTSLERPSWVEQMRNPASTSRIYGSIIVVVRRYFLFSYTQPHERLCFWQFSGFKIKYRATRIQTQPLEQTIISS